MEVKDDENKPDQIPLKQNGDFRSDECIELLKEADIIVTNPPFSLFREYIKQIVDHNKNFLVIGSMNAVTYKDIFGLIKDNKIWLGNNMVKEFQQPNGSSKKFGNINWFTNLTHKKRTENLILCKKYVGNEKDYSKYDNYDALEVSEVKNIPMDYDGYMGVPITFIDKYNPDQFEIIGIDRVLVEEATGKVSRFRIENEEIYARIVIKNKQINGEIK